MSKEMQIKVEPVQAPALKWNYEDVKEAVSEIAKRYAGMIYTDDDIKAAKADRAELRSLKKALNDERIRQEREYMEPFNEFKSQVRELTRMIDEPVRAIDEQVKAYEEKKREEKAAEIKKLQEEAGLKEFEDMVLKNEYMNSSYSLKRVKADLEATAAKVKAEKALLEQQLEGVYQKVALTVYNQTLDLTQAFTEAKKVQELDELAEKMRKQEEEEKAEQITVEEIQEPEAVMPAEEDLAVDFIETTPLDEVGAVSTPLDDAQIDDMSTPLDAVDDDLPDIFKEAFEMPTDCYTIKLHINAGQLAILQEWLRRTNYDFELQR
jgi:hypothetical protein